MHHKHCILNNNQHDFGMHPFWHSLVNRHLHLKLMFDGEREKKYVFLWLLSGLIFMTFGCRAWVSDGTNFYLKI